MLTMCSGTTIRCVLMNCIVSRVRFRSDFETFKHNDLHLCVKRKEVKSPAILINHSEADQFFDKQTNNLNYHQFKSVLLYDRGKQFIFIQNVIQLSKINRCILIIDQIDGWENDDNEEATILRILQYQKCLSSSKTHVLKTEISVIKPFLNRCFE